MARDRRFYDQQVAHLPEPFQRLWADPQHQEGFLRARGSMIKHQPWEGGWADHQEEIWALAHLLAPVWEYWTGMPLLTDALTLLAYHDLEKPFKYIPHEWTEQAHHSDRFKAWLRDQYNLPLDTRLMEAYDDVRWGVHSPLGGFIHTCDVLSARLWAHEPAATGQLPLVLGRSPQYPVGVSPLEDTYAALQTQGRILPSQRSIERVLRARTDAAIALRPAEQTALRHLEGEGTEYRQDVLVMTPLGACAHVVHCLEGWSQAST
jgi:hypothetical protein